MIPAKTLLPALALAAATGLRADWQPEFTFSDSSEMSRITDVTNIVDSGAHSEIADGQLYVYPGDLFDSTSNLYAMLHLNEDLKAESMATGQPVTVFMEITQPMVDGHKALIDTVWGLSNVDPDVVADTDNRYNSYNMMAHVSAGNDNFEIRDGGAFESVDLLQADVKYKMWFVIDYNLNVFEYYIQGGQWPTQTRIVSNPDGGLPGYYLFRVDPGADQTVDYMLIALSAGNLGAPKGRDPTIFDNIYVDTTGQNLTDPAGGGTSSPTWAGYSVTDGWAQTGNFLGDIYVGMTPFSGWAWDSALGTWIYVDESWVTDSGSWVYVTK